MLVEIVDKINTNMAGSVNGVEGGMELKKTLYFSIWANTSIKAKLDGLYYDPSIMPLLVATTLHLHVPL